MLINITIMIRIYLLKNTLCQLVLVLRHLLNHDMDSSSLQLRLAIVTHKPLHDLIILLLSHFLTILIHFREPGVMHGLHGGDPLFWVLSKHFCQQIRKLRAKVLRKVRIYTPDHIK